MDNTNYTTVTVADRRNCIGEGFRLKTISLKNTCPTCGGKRFTEMYKGRSYDGSRWEVVDCWRNECGHVDKYLDAILEAEAEQLKQ